MPGSMSQSMSLKGDHDMHLKKALKKHRISDFHSEEWADGSVVGIDYHDINLKDQTTWGGDEDPSIPMPPGQAFLDTYKAIVADEKRQRKRSSYEF